MGRAPGLRRAETCRGLWWPRGKQHFMRTGDPMKIELSNQGGRKKTKSTQTHRCPRKTASQEARFRHECHMLQEPEQRRVVVRTGFGQKWVLEDLLSRLVEW